MSKNILRNEARAFSSNDAPGVPAAAPATSHSAARDTLGTNPCRSKLCLTCPYVEQDHIFQGLYRTKQFSVLHNGFRLDCKTKNIVYLITCKDCGLQYVGETGRQFNTRMAEHRNSFKKPDTASCKILAKHFGTSICKNFSMQIIEKLSNVTNKSQETEAHKKREKFWIMQLRTKAPYGLNQQLTGQTSEKSILANLSLPRESNKYRGKPNHKRTREQPFNPSHYLQYFYDSFENDKKATFELLYKRTISLAKRKIKCLTLFMTFKTEKHILDDIIEDILLFRNETKTDSTKKETKPLLILNYVNKGFDDLYLSKIFRHPEVTATYPTNFSKNSIFQPLVAFQYDKPISKNLFNYRQTVEEVHSNTNWPSGAFSCNCSNSPFKDTYHKHIVTQNTA